MTYSTNVGEEHRNMLFPLWCTKSRSQPRAS